MWCRKWIWDKTKWTLICKTSFKMKNLQLFRTNNSLSNRNTLLEDYSHLCIFIPRELMNWHDLFHVKEIKLEKRRAFSIFLLKSLIYLTYFHAFELWIRTLKIDWAALRFFLGLSELSELSSFCFKPLAQAGLMYEYLCNFVFSNLVFQHWVKVFKQIFCWNDIYSIDSRFLRPELFPMHQPPFR